MHHRRHVLGDLLPHKSDDNLIPCKIMAELDDHFPLHLTAFIAAWYLCRLPSHLSVLQFLCQNPPPPFQGQKFPNIMAAFLVQYETNCSSERCQNYWSIINPYCFQWQAKSNRPQMKFIRSINPGYANIWCYKCVQSDRCIFIGLCAISICMVMKPSKGIQQVRWETNSFHQHHCLHLLISGICQKQKKLIKPTPAAVSLTSLPLKHRTCPSDPCLSTELGPATSRDRTSCCRICSWFNQPKEILGYMNLYSLLP